MTPPHPEGPLRRGVRTAVGWLWFLAGLASLSLIVLVMQPVLRALNRWADGDPVDLMGFAAILGVLFPFMAQIIAQGAQWMQSRTNERRDMIARGVAPPPFSQGSPSPPPSDEPLINPHGGPGAP